MPTMKLTELVEFIASRDELSWVGHFLICVPFTYLGGFINPLAAVFITEALVIYFGMREGSNWQTHKEKGHPRKRYMRDGIGDIAGPILCHAYAWTVFIQSIL